jgi:hypothetical protein
MASPAPQILLQTTIPLLPDDWHIGRFSLLREHLAGLRNSDGSPRYEVLARNLEREDDGTDPVLRDLGSSDIAELWLFAVDTVDGLSDAEAAGIVAFRRRGGGVLFARDHQDVDPSLSSLGSLGRVNSPDAGYRSGNVGDYQTIVPLDPVHDLLRSAKAPGGIIKQFPANPHEGAVDTAGLTQARAIATGTSQPGGTFDIAVVLENDVDEHGGKLGRAIAESTYRHFCDYNWNVASGAPSTARDSSGDGIAKDPATLEIYKDYITNLAGWLCGAPPHHWWSRPV